MPIKPKEPESQFGNWVASVTCAVYIIANMVWLHDDPSLSLSGFALFGIVLPLISVSFTIWATKKKLINHPIPAICVIVALIFALVAWTFFYLIAIGSAQF